MSSLKQDFDELVTRIKQGREFQHASFEPVYYLVFSPKQIIEVKRQTKAWIQMLQKQGWNVELLSIANTIQKILDDVPPFLMDVWREEDAKNPLEWKGANATIQEWLLDADHGIRKVIEEKLLSLEGVERALLLVSDLEALHPYLRVGTIEGQLQGKFNTPTVFLYPGIRTGQSQLKFLGFYPEDGNYRSIHVGG
jgi:hypothetical protein